jgi:hypothetical protein
MRWLLDLAYPLIGNRPIGNLSAPELLEVLGKVELRGRYETAKRLCSTFEDFRYAIVTGRAQHDVSADLRGTLITPKTQHPAAMLEPSAFGGLLWAFFGPSMLMMASQRSESRSRCFHICFPRPGELRMAEWKEFDLETAIWTIPALKTKMRRPHKVPPRSRFSICWQSWSRSPAIANTSFPASAQLTVRSPTIPSMPLRRLGLRKDQTKFATRLGGQEAGGQHVEQAALPNAEADELGRIIIATPELRGGTGNIAAVRKEARVRVCNNIRARPPDRGRGIV